MVATPIDSTWVDQSPLKKSISSEYPSTAPVEYTSWMELKRVSSSLMILSNLPMNLRFFSMFEERLGVRALTSLR